MPSLARLYVRTSLVYLAIGALLGGFMLWNEGWRLVPDASRWLPVHISVMTWGWLWQLTLGTAYWILPRTGNRRPRAWLAGLAYVCLNGGLWLAAATPWLGGPWPAAFAGLLQLAAALAFAAHAWPRLRPGPGAFPG